MLTSCQGDEAEPEPEPQGSSFKPLIDLASTQYNDTWRANEADKTNFHQKHDVEMIKQLKRKEVEAALRLEVDELMREELSNLKAAVDKDKKKKGKKGKKVKPTPHPLQCLTVLTGQERKEGEEREREEGQRWKEREGPDFRPYTRVTV